LSAAIRDGSAGETLAVLEDTALDDVARLEHPKTADGIVGLVEAELESLLESESPDEALSRLERFRVLCVTHRGPYGVDSVNRAFDRRVEARGAQAWGRWYHGRPVIVTVNDYVTGLFNGDVGVCLADAELGYAVWFRLADGSLRKFPPARLPEHKTAWALTVHKSQGSEFDRVVVVLPEQDSALLTRELVYTAATRARSEVVFVGPAGSIATAVGRRADRTSGLAELLSQPRV
jgi:exodeoxyribonuclease V alpha subunit